MLTWPEVKKQQICSVTKASHKFDQDNHELETKCSNIESSTDLTTLNVGK